MQNFAKTDDMPEKPDRDDEILRLQAEFLRIQDLYLRALADLDNFRKKVQQDQTKVARVGKREILLRVVEVLDSFDRALEQTSGLPESVTAGFEGIRRQLLNILKLEGVSPMETLGQVFEPALHEAIATVGDDRETPGTIVAELSRGYRWQDELLRPAKVSVAH